MCFTLLFIYQFPRSLCKMISRNFSSNLICFFFFSLNFFFFQFSTFKSTNHSGENFEKPKYLHLHTTRNFDYENGFLMSYHTVLSGLELVELLLLHLERIQKRKNHFIFESSVCHRIFTFTFEQNRKQFHKNGRIIFHSV